MASKDITVTLPFKVGEKAWVIERDDDGPYVLPVKIEGYEINEFGIEIHYKNIDGISEWPQISEDSSGYDEDFMHDQYIYRYRYEAEEKIRED